MREVNWRLGAIGKRINSNLSIQATLHGLTLEGEGTADDTPELDDKQQEAMEKDLAKIMSKKRQK